MNINPINNNFLNFSALKLFSKKSRQNRVDPRAIYDEYKPDTVNIGTKKNIGYTGWVEIPSKNHDYNNFKSNVKLLNFLWNYKWDNETDNWQQKPSFENALVKDDFHIYCKMGKPVIALQVNNMNELVKVYGLDDEEAEEKYSGIVSEHLENCKDINYSLMY